MIHVTDPVLAACWAIFAVVWIVTAFFTKRTVASRGWWRVTLAIVIVATIVLQRGVWPSGSAPLWPQTLAVRVLGDVLGIAGVGIMVWARLTIGSNWSGGIVLKEEHELVTRGPYRYVRHPIYSGLLLLILGTGIGYGRLLGLVLFVVATVLFSIKARAEERLLTEHFPEAYPAYRARVKALVPGVL